MEDSKHELSAINMFYPAPPTHAKKKIIVILCPYLPITVTSLQRPLSSPSKVAVLEGFDCISIHAISTIG